MNKKATIGTMLAVTVLSGLMMACEKPADGPAEKAGEKIDEAGKKVGNAMEEAGEKMEEKFGD